MLVRELRECNGDMPFIGGAAWKQARRVLKINSKLGFRAEKPIDPILESWGFDLVSLRPVNRDKFEAMWKACHHLRKPRKWRKRAADALAADKQQRSVQSRQPISEHPCAGYAYTGSGPFAGPSLQDSIVNGMREQQEEAVYQERKLYQEGLINAARSRFR
jgi:hypothetical protein